MDKSLGLPNSYHDRFQSSEWLGVYLIMDDLWRSIQRVLPHTRGA
jgi:hypothetical protein